MFDQYVGQARLLLQILPLIKEYTCFGLKGGTAINFFIQDFPRLSVDIDLCYHLINSRDEALSQITASMEDLEIKIHRRFKGSHIQIKKTESGIIRGMVVHHNGVTIKVEPNLVIRGTVNPLVTRSLTPKASEFFQLELDYPVLSKADLYGGKICAALDRQHPRDLFDVFLLLEKNEFDRSIFNAFLVYLISHPRPIAELLNPNKKDIQDVFEKEFRTMTDSDVSVDELIQTRENLVKSIHSQFTAEDKAFLLSLKDNNPLWELFPIKHASSLPAVIWKNMNIAKMKPDAREKARLKLEKTLNGDFLK
ncbi:MAG: nucleotidyl transferase AbiEii/AbiGii toxin family protein [Spirochaetales bacterium]|nr:nucleotidyl transferase AbiEii/AbiGii toxin family protein [Spirochaetales bacterium]